MNFHSGLPFLKIVQTKPNDQPTRLRRNLIKGETYECPDCFKTLKKSNYSYHNKTCSVKKKKLKEYDDKIVYQSSDRKINTFTRSIVLDQEHEQFEVTPTNRQRDCIIIIGAAGAGKSYWINEYIKKWKEKNKGQSVYFFSALSSDESITEKVDRIDLDKFMAEDELFLEDLEGALLIADDVDCLQNKIRKKLYNYLHYLLYTGRHVRCSIVITLHSPTTRNADTVPLLNESHLIISFPNSLGNRSIDYIYDKYLGLDTAQIKKLRKMADDSRWIGITKTTPKILFSQYEALALYSSNPDELTK